MRRRYLDFKESYHLLHDCGYKGGEKGSNVGTKFLPGIPSTSPENPAEYISTANIVGNTTIAQRKGEGSDVISNDTICGIDPIDIFCTKFTLVRSDSSHFLDFVEYRSEDISVII